MKKISWKEVLFLTAPIAIIALGFWGARFREEKWPTQPRIIECRVRPATPLEISQGANVGVTVRAVVPNTPEMDQLDPRFNCQLWSRDHTHSESAEQKSVIGGFRTEAKYGRNELIRSFAYILEQSENKPILTAKIQLEFPDDNVASLTRQFEFSSDDIEFPNVSLARHTNFRVAKAMLLTPSKNTGSTGEEIMLDIVDLSRELPDTIPTANCLGRWEMQDSGNRSLSISSSMQQNEEKKTAKVTIYFTYSKRRALPKLSAKIRGQISINDGWPQEITFEWPKILARSPAQTEMKFSTKLAPPPK